MNKSDEILDRLRGQQPVIDNPEELTDLIMSSLPERNHPDRVGVSKPRRLTLPLKGMAGGLVAAGIALLIVLHYNNKVEPTEQPVVAEVVEPESPRPVSEPAPEPVVAQEKPQEKPKARVARTSESVAIVKQEEKPEVAEENLLAEAQNTPIPKGKGESPVELPVLPPERQALVDMFLAEEALQVAYMQQEQTKELRAFTAGLEGKEPETSHLITSF